MVKGSGTDILVIDKGGIGAGASGIACGVVRNNYYQPAMRELMAQCVEVWESDPEAFSYHPVGYMQISPECMREDVNSIFEQQRAIGYESEFIEGAHDSSEYMKSIFLIGEHKESLQYFTKSAADMQIIVNPSTD